MRTAAGMLSRRRPRVEDLLVEDLQRRVLTRTNVDERILRHFAGERHPSRAPDVILVASASEQFGFAVRVHLAPAGQNATANVDGDLDDDLPWSRASPRSVPGSRVTRDSGSFGFRALGSRRMRVAAGDCSTANLTSILDGKPSRGREPLWQFCGKTSCICMSSVAPRRTRPWLQPIEMLMFPHLRACPRRHIGHFHNPKVRSSSLLPATKHINDLGRAARPAPRFETPRSLPVSSSFVATCERFSPSSSCRKYVAGSHGAGA
jgi:hypothetical protein